MNLHVRHYLMAISVCLGCVGMADAQIPATIYSVSSNLVGFDRAADYLLDGSGLVGGTHSITPDANMWLNQGSFGGGPADLDPSIAFDLGSVVSLANVQIWNYNETLPGREDLLNRGVASLDILISNNGVDYTSLIDGQALPLAPGSDSVDFGEVIDLGGASARYVLFDNLINHGGDNDFVGLSEVQFTAVPEPSTLLLVTFAAAGLLGMSHRRKR